MKVFFNNIHYKTTLDIKEKMLMLALTPISFIYSKISDVRVFLYEKNIMKSYKPGILTISVGNLTTGGTGKTPITAEIANYLNRKGYKVAILSRGYGGNLNKKNINMISDGHEIYYSASEAGDEPVWLAQNCPNVCVLTSSNRVQIAKYAEKELQCNAIILDDGYQHLKIKRDINIAVVDNEKVFGNCKVLPIGPLRENIKNIKRSDKIILVSKNPDVSLHDSLEKIKTISSSEILQCIMQPTTVYEINSNEKLNDNSDILAFSAIGQPLQFYNLLRDKFNLVGTYDFEDHHMYSESDVKFLFDLANKSNATLVTTEKDAVKLKCVTNKPIYVLRLEPQIDMEKLIEV